MTPFSYSHIPNLDMLSHLKTKRLSYSIDGILLSSFCIAKYNQRFLRTFGFPTNEQFFSELMTCFFRMENWRMDNIHEVSFMVNKILNYRPFCCFFGWQLDDIWYLVFSVVYLVWLLTLLCVSFNHKAPDPNFGDLKNQEKIYQFSPSNKKCQF